MTDFERAVADLIARARTLCGRYKIEEGEHEATERIIARINGSWPALDAARTASAKPPEAGHCGGCKGLICVHNEFGGLDDLPCPGIRREP